MKIGSAIAFIIILLLAACERSAVNHPSSPPVPQLFTPTSEQTALASPTISVTVAPLPKTEATLPAEATLQALASAWGVCCDPIFLSPNGRWAGISGRAVKVNGQDEVGLVLVSIPEKVKWTYTYYDLTGWHDGFTYPVYWSLDGKYVYIGSSEFMSPQEFGGNFNALSRVDLSTGKLTEVLPSVMWENSSSYEFSFSDDGKYLAYAQVFLEGDLKVLDLSSREEMSFPIPGNHNIPSHLIWEWNDRRLIFSVISEWDHTNMLFLLDLGNQTITAYHIPDYSGPSFYVPAKWIDRRTIQINMLETWEKPIVENVFLFGSFHRGILPGTGFYSHAVMSSISIIKLDVPGPGQKALHNSEQTCACGICLDDLIRKCKPPLLDGLFS